MTWHLLETSRGKDFRRTVRGQFDGTLPNNEIHTRIWRAVFEFGFPNSAVEVPFIVILKDTDNKPDVQAALDELRKEPPKLEMVIGCVVHEQESWLLAAFEPETDDERQRLQDCCRGDFPPGVGFDPCAFSERLTATGKDDAKLSPKRVYKYLNDGDHQRSFRGLHRNHHERLKLRGQVNGLAAFLTDVEQRLLSSLFGVRVTSS